MSRPPKSASEPLLSQPDDQTSNSQNAGLRGEVFDVELLSSPKPHSNWKKGLKGAGVFGILLAIYGVYTLGATVGESKRKPLPIGPFPASKNGQAQIKVHVSGSVKKPGLYTLGENSRVQDAIEKAGGVSPKANLGALNLAAWVEDGSKIVVPSQVRATPTPVVILKETIVQVPVIIEPTIAPPVAYQPMTPNLAPAPNTFVPAVPNLPPPGPSAETTSNTDDGSPRDKTKSGAESSNLSAEYLLAHPVDLNQATASQLEALPDIGPKTAERIIAYRATNGRFNRIEELDNVKGIGEKTLLKLKPYIVAR